MTELRLSLVLTADGKGLRTEVAADKKAVQDFGVAAEKAGIGAGRGLSQAEREARNADKAIRGAGNAAHSAGGQIRTLLTALATGFAVREIIQTADSWKLVEARLRLVTSSTQELKQVQEALFNSSQKTRQSFEATSDLYSRIARNANALGASQKDILTVTEAVNEGFIVSGASAEESKAAILQLGQALASGTLQGDELRSVLENAPRLAQAIADGLGVSVGELRKLGAAGELTAKQIFDALLKTAPQIAAEFSKVPLTVGQSLTQVGNSLKRLVGFSDEATGASAVLAHAFSDLAQRLSQPAAIAAATQLAEGVASALRGLVDVAIFAGEHIQALTIALSGLAAGKATSAIGGIVGSLVSGLGSAGSVLSGVIALLGGPLTLGIAAVGALATAWALFADELQPVNGSLATFQDYATAAWQTLKGFAGTIADTLTPAFKALGPIASTAWDTIKGALSSVWEIYKGYHNFIVNSFQALFTLPPIFARLLVASFQDGFGAAKDISSSFFADLANAFSGDFGFGNFRATLGKDLFAGVKQAASEAGQAIAQTYSQDQVGNAINAIGSIGAQWQANAETIAENRLETERLTNRFKAVEAPAKQSLGSIAIGSNKAAEALTKAREKADAFFKIVADLREQRDAIKGGNIVDLYNIQDLQKARDTLLEFGQEAKITTKDLSVLGRAYGKTVGDIATSLGEQRDLQKQINDLTEANKAPEKIKEYLKDLDQQNEKLQLEIAGRKDLVALLEAQQQLEGNIGRTLTNAELDDLRKRIDLQASLNNELEAQKEAQEAAKKNAELFLEPFKNAIQGIQNSFTGLFRNLFTGGVKSFRSLGKNIRNIFIELAAQLSTLLVFRPVLNFALGGNANTLGLGGNAPGSADSGGGLLGGLGNLFNGGGSGGLDFGKVFSGGNLDLGGLFKNIFGGATPKFIGGAGSGGASFTGGFFSNFSAGPALLGGLGAIPSLLKGDLKGGAISGIGGILGSFLPGPLGSVVGLLGGVLGGLFGKKKKTKKYRSIADIGVDDYGYLDVTGTRKNKRGSNDIAQQLGDQTTGAVNSLLDELGASFLPDVTGLAKAFSKKKGKKKKPTQYSGNFDGVVVESTTNLEEFIGDYATTALAIGSRRDKLEGVTETQKTIFNSLFARNNSSLEQLKEGITFSRLYDRTDEARTPAIAAADAIRKLTVELRKAQAQAEEFGLSVDRVKEVFKLNFEEDIANELLQLKDPGAYALQELEKEYQARLAVAQRLGADVTQLEELYALKRKQVIEENLNSGLSGIKSRLQEFVRSLTQGELSALSPTQRFASARKDFADAVTKKDEDSLQETGQTLLQVAREFYGSGVKYAEIFREVLKAAGDLGGFTIDIPGFAKGGHHLGGLRLVGEKGPELETTGAARYFSNAQTIDLLRQASTNDNRFLRAPLLPIQRQPEQSAFYAEKVARAIREQDTAQADRDRRMLEAVSANAKDQQRQIKEARFSRLRGEMDSRYGRKSA